MPAKWRKDVVQHVLFSIGTMFSLHTIQGKNPSRYLNKKEEAEQMLQMW